MHLRIELLVANFVTNLHLTLQCCKFKANIWRSSLVRNYSFRIHVECSRKSLAINYHTIYHTILYTIYHTIPRTIYHTIPYHIYTIPYHIPYHTIASHAIPYHIPYYTIPYHIPYTIPYQTIYHTIPNHTSTFRFSIINAFSFYVTYISYCAMHYHTCSKAFAMRCKFGNANP